MTVIQETKLQSLVREFSQSACCVGCKPFFEAPMYQQTAYCKEMTQKRHQNKTAEATVKVLEKSFMHMTLSWNR